MRRGNHVISNLASRRPSFTWVAWSRLNKTSPRTRSTGSGRNRGRYSQASLQTACLLARRHPARQRPPQRTSHIVQRLGGHTARTRHPRLSSRLWESRIGGCTLPVAVAPIQRPAPRCTGVARPGDGEAGSLRAKGPCARAAGTPRASSPRAPPAPGSLAVGPGGPVLPVCMFPQPSVRRVLCLRRLLAGASRRVSGMGRCSRGAWPRSCSGICRLRCWCGLRVRARRGGGRPGPVRGDPCGSRCRAGTPR
jgi:hypothetical protein